MVPIVSPEGEGPWNPGTGTLVSPVGVADWLAAGVSGPHILSTCRLRSRRSRPKNASWTNKVRFSELIIRLHVNLCQYSYDVHLVHTVCVCATWRYEGNASSSFVFFFLYLFFTFSIAWSAGGAVSTSASNRPGAQHTLSFSFVNWYTTLTSAGTDKEGGGVFAGTGERCLTFVSTQQHLG